ncbi:MAG: ABC transporter ATP-binding protein [Chloroflexota bacterium]
MIETNNLTKIFDEFIAVDNVTLNVEPGTVMALLGPNGAGKTTSVRMMTSILNPTSGTASIAGYDVVTQPEQVRAHVGVLTEQHGLYERMKGMRYLDFFGQVYHLTRQERQQRSQQLMERFGLGFAMDKRLGEYSKGMKQKLALVRAMLHNPPVLLLDEPTSAMDPQSAKQVRDAILELRGDKRTIMITTHNLPEAQLLADRIAIIRGGRIIADGSFAELSEQFVGVPLMELRVNGQLNGVAEDLEEMVEIENTGINWVRYRVPDPATTNPQIINRVTGLGKEVVTLAPVSQSLEDVYLKAVEEDESKHGSNNR